MTSLSESLQKQIREAFGALPAPVTLAVFTRANGAESLCETCGETLRLAEELAALSGGNVRVDAYDIDRDAEVARIYRIDKVPAIAVLADESPRRDVGIRFFGSPAGYEFGTLIEDIRMVSDGKTDLSAGTVEALSHLDAPLHIQVFVTPSCPYCPRAALLAHKMAMAGELVTADAIDATEFPEMAARYRVHGVPRTVINETIQVEGAVPEAMLMAQLISLVDSDRETVSGVEVP